ncbi:MULTISPECIES: GntR family transcriptional regulator [Streptomyces]|uniref:GntR family transcriptional regulator n=1 Tax=Streptomyces ramulosus TaxID=47762 RepID=A0ABW1FDF6_9ACTN
MAERPDPPYLRIAAALRRRIENGELAPGDRVPATRRLARESGVALATATKALAVLRQEGLIHATGRTGTVVAPRPARPGPRRTAAAPLPGAVPAADPGRDRLVRAAIALADAEGLAALSMRAVAGRLGVSAMAAYRHVQGKDELVALMTDTVLGELDHPRTPAPWRTRLEEGARALWRVHRAHPWLAQTGPLTRPQLLPRLLAYSEWMLAALDGRGLDAATVLDLNVLLYSHIQGLAVHAEREAHAAGQTGLTDEEWLDTQAPAMSALLGSGAYPTLARLLGEVGADGYDLRLDALFERGLRALLDDIARLVEEGAPPA